jgi:hypothetical protein
MSFAAMAQLVFEHHPRIGRVAIVLGNVSIPLRASHYLLYKSKAIFYELNS